MLLIQIYISLEFRIDIAVPLQGPCLVCTNKFRTNKTGPWQASNSKLYAYQYNLHVNFSITPTN